jgi:lipopolysaccharide transport system ATP-binding protein
MSELTIAARGLGKRYRLGTSIFAMPSRGGAGIPADTGTRLSESWLWALRDVDLEVRAGDLLGIVGANGAGKTTLLKLLSRITAPTLGRAEIRGRIGSLLEIGMGFNWELTGRENVYLNGLVLGMTRREIARRFDEIVAFSGTESFIDTPMKRFSSGMIARLGFAVAAHLDADILIVDEVLAVGDVAFQRKCMDRMRALSAQHGKSILFVSHSAESVIDLCTRAIWLRDGRLAGAGGARDVVHAYLAAGRANGASSGALTVAGRSGSGDLQITGGAISAPDGAAPNKAIVGQPMTITLGYHARRNDLITVSFALSIRDREGRRIAELSTRLRGQDFAHLGGAGTVECRLPRCPLVPGGYTLDLEASWPGTVLDRLPQALVFEVLPGRFFDNGMAQTPGGFVFLEQDWSSSSR